MAQNASRINMQTAVGLQDTTLTRSGGGTYDSGNGVALTRNDANGNQQQLAVQRNIQNLLGDVQLSQLPYRNLDLHEGTPHTTTGLPYAMSGTATVINQQVATHLAGFQDPIKSIFGTRIEESKKIVIKRKYVVGGSAIVVPERAPARSVAIKEDIREIELARYGADLEMNLNLFLSNDPSRPAETELNMKLDAQKRALEQQLVELGYDEIMMKGTRLDVALAKAMPCKFSTGQDRQHAIDRNYQLSLFGCMSKHENAFVNMLAAAKKANLYTPTSGSDNFSVMIVPSGMMELDQVTKRENMEYSVSGVALPNRKKITMPLENVVVDPRTNLRILTRVQPMTNTRNGAKSDGGLLREVTLYMRIPGDDSGAKRYVPNFVKGVDQEVSKAYRKVVFKMSSAILCNDPGNCGELLMAFPMSAVSTSTTTETMRMQLRCYLGACLYDPEKVVIIPDVQFECVISDEQVDKSGVTHADGNPYSDEELKALPQSACSKADTKYHNNGPLGWLDYSTCARVHGAYSYEDNFRREAHAKFVSSGLTQMGGPLSSSAGSFASSNAAGGPTSTSAPLRVEKTFSPPLSDLTGFSPTKRSAKDSSSKATAQAAKPAEPLATDSSLGLGMQVEPVDGSKSRSKKARTK